MCGLINTNWQQPTTKRVTVIERTFDDSGNLVKEVETVTETTSGGSGYSGPWNPPYQVTF